MSYNELVRRLDALEKRVADQAKEIQELKKKLSGQKPTKKVSK